MPFARPTLTSLFQQAMNDVVAGLTGGNSLLAKSVLRVVTWVLAQFAHLNYGYLDWISKQSVPWTATDEFLLGWAGLKNVTLKDASVATGLVQFTGSLNAPLPAGSPVNGNGVSYTTTADGRVGSDLTVTVPVEASTAGSSGNAAVGTAMTLGTAIPGINSIGAVVAPSSSSTAGLTGGADTETQDALRTRMLKVYAAPAQGGDSDDYVEWAEAVSGVTRAWCRPNGAGAGTVVVYFMMDDANAAFGGFPQGTNGVSSGDQGPDSLPRDTVSTGDQLTVANAILPNQGATALVYACAPAAYEVTFQINDISGITETMKAAIVSALQGVTIRKADPKGGVIYPSDWEEAIAAVSGVTSFTLASPTLPVSAPVGQIPTVISANVAFGTS